MQRVTLVRYTAKPAHAVENEALSRAVFEDLRARPPAGVAYGLFRDGLEFVHVFINLTQDSSEAVTGLPSFKAFEQDIAARCEAPPQATRLSLQLVDSYGLGKALALT